MPEFAPFQPPGEAPAPQAEPPASTETAKEKKAREKREAKEAKAAAKAAKPASEPQKRRSTGTPKTLKFDLQTILGAASTLNQDDYPLFEKLINLLDEAGKPGRERLLEAVNKVFA